MPVLFLIVGACLFVLLVGSSASTGVANEQPRGQLPIWGQDINVVSSIPTPTGERSLQRNFSMAVNPTNPQMLLAGFDHQRDFFLESGYGVSLDAGQTWQAGIFRGAWIDDKMPIGDVTVAFDSQGTGYLSSYAHDLQSGGYYLITTTNGMNWTTPVPIVESNDDEFKYRARFAIDTSPTSPYRDRFTAVWNLSTLDFPYKWGVLSRYSTDRGATWGPEYQVSDPQYNFSYGPSVVSAPNGTLYASWLHMDNDYILNPHRLMIDRSTDGGVTWGADRQIGNGPISTIGGFDWKGRELVLVADGKCSIMRIFHFPYIAVSPHDSNTVYAVWNDGRWDQEQYLCGDVRNASDIAFSKTTDGGVTWTTPARINDDPLGNLVDQFQPTITTRADGLIGVTWLDRRDDPQHFKYDLYYSQSIDGGATWSPNQRVSDVSNDPNPLVDYKSVDDIGYKNSLVYTQDRVIPSWIHTIEDTLDARFFVDRGLIDPVIQTATPGQPTPSATRTRTAVATPQTGTPTPGTTCTIEFSDVPPTHTFYANIRCLACNGVLGGYSDGTFRPGNNITRGQIAKVVSNAAGFSEPVTGQTYTDVPTTQTFYAWIERLSARGVMGGYTCGGPGEPCDDEGRAYFRPGADATRGQLSKIVANAAGLNDPVTGQFYTDVPTTHTFYTEIMRLTALGVMSGYQCGAVAGEPCDAENRPYFRPGAAVTRGQASKIVANTFFPGCVSP